MKRNSSLLAVMLAAAVGITVVWVGNHFGFWWVTLLVGLGIGLLLRGARATLVAATLAAVGGWGLDLLWQSLHADIGGAASVVAGIMGFGVASGYVVILLTLVFAELLSLAGAWVGAALRQTGVEVRSYRPGQAHAGLHNTTGATGVEPAQVHATAMTQVASIQKVEG